MSISTILTEAKLLWVLDRETPNLLIKRHLSVDIISTERYLIWPNFLQKKINQSHKSLAHPADQTMPLLLHVTELSKANRRKNNVAKDF